MTDPNPPRPLPEEEEEPFRPEDEAAARPAPEPPYPWDEPSAGDPGTPSSEASPQEEPRQRHDAFTEAKKAAFLTALVKTGCLLDACRLTGTPPRTVYRHQERDRRFLDHCHAALRMSGTPVELTAWQRAVEGVEEQFCVGGEVRVRRRYDSNLLRLLLQGSNPKKYGPRPGFKRKRLLRHERKQIEREIRAEIAAETPDCTFDESIVELDQALEKFGFRQEAEKLASGWTRSPEGHWVPPGYAPIPGWVAPPAPADGGGIPQWGSAPPSAPADGGEIPQWGSAPPSAPADGGEIPQWGSAPSSGLDGG